MERGLRRERRAGAPRMYRADKVREEPGRGQGGAQEHWAAYRTKTEKGPEGTNNGLPSHPPPSTQIRISSSSMSALGRMEPGAAGATQAGRHRPPCRDGHGMQPALRVCRPRLGLLRLDCDKVSMYLIRSNLLEPLLYGL